MAWSDDSESLLRRLRHQLEQINNDQVRRAAAAWAAGWDDVAPELAHALDNLVIAAGNGRLTRSQIIRTERLTNALELIAARLSRLFGAVAADVIGDLEHVVNNAGFITELMVNSQLPQNILDGRQQSSWSRINPIAVDEIVYRATEQITALTYPLADEATAVMKRELVRGMLTGANPRETARRMLANTERRFNGGLSRALTIARTETMDAHRLAAELSERQHADVLLGWTWVATLGERTCPACWSMHGQQFPPSVPGPLGHQNCRCARVPVAKSWADLGFDIEEPPSILPDREATFAALSAAKQQAILGPARYDAWKAGDYPMSKWSVRRENPDWRASYVVSPAPKAA